MHSLQISLINRLAALSAAMAVAACGGGGSGDGAPGTGSLKVMLTDAPACGYDNVWVTVTKVRVHRSETAGDNDEGWSEVLVDPANAGRKIDLLELQNGVMAELGKMALPTGRYSQVRLVLAENTGVASANEIVLSADRKRVPLDTPSAQQSGLKLKHGFDVEPDTEVDLVLDFDACRSIVKAGNSGKYNLKPVISAIPVLTGSISGSVEPSAARVDAAVSLQRFDPSTGDVSVVRATTVRADGTWTLSPVPVPPASGPGYHLVIGSRGYASVVYTNVPVTTGATTSAPAVTLSRTSERRISGTISAATADSHATVQVLQRVLAATGTSAGVVIEAAVTNADAISGEYAASVPLAAARVASYGQALAPGINEGLYTVTAVKGGEKSSKPSDVTAGDDVVDFGF